MLSREDNDLVTQTNQGTPMGNLIRRYWVPALLSEEIPAADCPPVRVKLMGEDLVAFRDTKDASVSSASTAPTAARRFFSAATKSAVCAVFTMAGNTTLRAMLLKLPRNPLTATFAKSSAIRRIPTHEANGVDLCVPRAARIDAALSQLRMDPSAAGVFLRDQSLLECNYLQGLEGECDSSHLSFLHRAFTNERNQPLYKSDTAPFYETEDTDFGVRLIATRNFDNQHYIRFSAFIMPVYGCVPAGRPTNELEGYEIHTYVPADDTHCWRYDIGFRRDRAVSDDEVHRRKQINPDYTRIRNARNNYLQDRQMQKKINFTGIEDFLNHDACATESMGAIFDRSREHLGVSDKAVIAVRRFLLTSVKEFNTGKEPPHILRDVARNWFPHIDCFAHMLGREVPWRQHFNYLTATAEKENPASYTARRKAAS